MNTANQPVQAPTPEELIKITFAHKKRLRELNRQQAWSVNDFQQVLYCHREWSPNQQDWYIPYEVITRLLFDRRTREDFAQKLHQFATIMDACIQQKESTQKTEER